jgi:imidazolonepropionase-like amidohydrolase
MRRLILICFAMVICPAIARANPEIPGAPQGGPVALVGGTVHPVSGAAIDKGMVVFDLGKIVAVGADATIPDNAKRVDVTGKHVYPGLIDANSQLGLLEVQSVAGPYDVEETGLINPNVRAEVAVNPDSELIPVSRSGGVLAVLTAPAGRLIVGTSACMVLDGWTWEDMCLQGAIGLHVVWPRMQPLEAWWIETSAADQLSSRDRSLAAIRQAFADARAYRAAKLAAASNPQAAPEHDARWEAMLPVLEGKLRVFIEADDIQQIQAALAFAEQLEVKPVIVGGYDADKCVPLLKKLGAPVIIGGVHRTPARRHDAYDSAFTLPERLRAAGIAYCIAGVTDGASGSSAANTRNLPYHAGTAAAYGLSADEALKSITLYPAQILGVADRLGSLEAGKDATLIVTDGDVLDIPTHVTAAYIRGAEVSLMDRHKRLWEKYKEKYRRLGIEN